MIFVAFYRIMIIPPKSEDITFEEFLKELPADYSEIAYEFKAFTRSRKIKTPAQLLQVVMLYCGLDHVLRETAGVFTLQEDRITDTAIHKRLKACEQRTVVKSVVNENATQRNKRFNIVTFFGCRWLLSPRTWR